MRTKNFLKHLFLGALLLSAGKVVGQSTVPGNAGIATDFLGWDNTGTNNFPLMVRHDLNQPIEWYTDAVLRMRLAPTLTNQNWAWWQTGTLDFSGHLGLGSTTPASPLTYLHINQGGLGAISVGYRPWMRTGVFTSESSDAMYVGLHRSTNNQANAVINWSDDLGGTNPDALRFIFTTVPDSSSVAATYRGLELARLIPAGSGDEGFFGVGDFFSPALQPTERVDILDGRLRIRQLPDDSAAVDSFYVMVVDRTALTTNNQERGVVKWVAPDALGGSDCDWVVQSPEPHVSSVYTGTNCPWSEKHGVGMGVQIPKMKLQVFHTDNSLLNRIAIWGSSRFMVEDGQEVQGIIGEARPPAQDVSNMNAFGVMGVAEGSKFCTGVEGRGLMDQYTSGTAASVIGVSGRAVASNNANVCIGVYGSAGGATNPADDWAAWFDGEGFLGATTWTYSDHQFKSGVQSLEGASALEKIMSLNAKRYTFNTEEFAHLHLPGGEQFGLIAQEVEQVLPQLVKAAHRPERVDSTGMVVEEALDFKAMNYVGLIPVIIAAMQEQQAKIATLESQLAACCANPTVPADGKAVGSEQETLQGEPRSLLISPNPFNEATTLTYVLEREGRAQLLVNSADGKHLRSLFEGQRTAGEHRYEWSTADLLPGIYYVTLLFEGQPLVKKAVKVAR